MTATDLKRSLRAVTGENQTVLTRRRMNIDSINKWLTLVVNIGVLVGIIFLVLELDQANRISRYESENARRSQFININSNMIEHAEMYAMLQGDATNLTPAESVKALMMARMLMNNWSDAESAYNYGLLSEATLVVTLNDVPVTLSEAPGLLPYIAYLYYSYGQSINNSLVNQRMADVLRDAGFEHDSDKIYAPALSN